MRFHLGRTAGLLILMLLSCHWVSCILLIVSQPVFPEYSDSFFIAIFLVLGTTPSHESKSYDAFMVHAESEGRWIIALAVIVGVMFFIAISGAFVSAWWKFVYDSSERGAQVKNVRTILHDVKAPECLRQDVERWVNVWQKQYMKDIQHCSWDRASGRLQFWDHDEVERRLLAGPLLRQLEMTSPGFVASFACLVQHEVVIKGDYFFLEGEVGTHIHFIEDGIVQLIDLCNEPVGCCWARLQPKWLSAAPPVHGSIAKGVPLNKDGGRTELQIGSDAPASSRNENHVGPGAVIGDVALICGVLQQTSAIAIQDCVSWALEKEAASDLLQGYQKAAQEWHFVISRHPATDGQDS